MSDIAQQNFDLLADRWPELARKVLATQPKREMHWEGSENQPTLAIDGRRLWSAYDAEAEARTQASMVPQASTHAWAYGVGSGDLMRELLGRSHLERLHVVPLDLGVLNVLLQVVDHRDWLSDPRVQLHDPSGQERVNRPFAAVPPCLSLITGDLGRLQERLEHELLRPFESERLQKRAQLRERHIDANRELVASDGDVAELFGSRPRTTAFVCAAGPTLWKTAPWIVGHRDEGILVAVDGALTPLLRQGLVPDIVLSLDDNPETIIEYFRGNLAHCSEGVLVYTPIVDPAALRLWPGQRKTMYTEEPVYDAIRSEYPKGQLYVAGSVTHPAVDLAVRLGAARVMLFGTDFGFPDRQIHANADAPLAFYEAGAKAGTTTMNGHGQTIGSLSSFQGYRMGLERYIRDHRDVTFVNMSRDGARIEGAVYADQIE
ncbi:MAG: motility associated factor glycosyltransferase family protein [Gammaproteobacteria bacterium]|nr:motility associated factor glycosyltransferase family protein [Gammaproteobacteria bacterium]